MAKPRRKHIGTDIMEGSRQGQFMIEHIQGSLGAMNYRAIYEQPGVGVGFALMGPQGVGYLAQAKERREADLWVHEFHYLETLYADVDLQLRLTCYRWDPWLHAEETGNRMYLDLSPRRRRLETWRRSNEVGAARDVFVQVWSGKDARPADLLGIPVAALDAERAAVRSSAA